ncbi:DUF1700 domain-containing protein [Acetobacter sp.]|uniref:DUF1700 domain-containing protein n=1 Tax=Acetobacter sp. TaxID=440 RepID=UPI0039EBE56D
MRQAPEDSRLLFLTRLRTGLKGLPRTVIEEAVADYEAHFEAGHAAGRTEADIAQRLGDPARLAREIRAEAGVRRWEDERSLGSALGAIVGILGLAAIDLLIVLPILFLVGVCILAFIAAGAALCLGGCLLLPFGLLDIHPDVGSDWLQNVMICLGLVTAGISITSFCILVTIGIFNLLMRYGRAHYRLIAPSQTL